MAKRASIDANGLLRLLLNDIPEQARAVIDLLDKGYRFEVADLIIAELVFILGGKDYGFNRQETAKAIGRILDDSGFSCNNQLFYSAFGLYVSHPALSFIDCCAVYYAQLNDALPLYTFDKKLVNQSGRLAKAIT